MARLSVFVPRFRGTWTSRSVQTILLIATSQAGAHFRRDAALQAMHGTCRRTPIRQAPDFPSRTSLHTMQFVNPAFPPRLGMLPLQTRHLHHRCTSPEWRRNLRQAVETRDGGSPIRRKFDRLGRLRRILHQAEQPARYARFAFRGKQVRGFQAPLSGERRGPIPVELSNQAGVFSCRACRGCTGCRDSRHKRRRNRRARSSQEGPPAAFVRMLRNALLAHLDLSGTVVRPGAVRSISSPQSSRHFVHARQ